MAAFGTLADDIKSGEFKKIYYVGAGFSDLSLYFF